MKKIRQSTEKNFGVLKKKNLGTEKKNYGTEKNHESTEKLLGYRKFSKSFANRAKYPLF